MGKIGDAVNTAFYEPHLNKMRMANDPSKNRQEMIARMYMRVISNLAVNRFKWIGLPDTVDERFLETTLFTNGLAIFYWDERVSRYLTLRGSGVGKTNMYDNPTVFNTYGAPGYNGRRLQGNECVPIWSNYMRQGDLDIVSVYATKLADLDRTIELNSHNMRFPKAVSTNENNKHTWDNILRLYDSGAPIILSSQGLNLEDAQVMDLGVDPRSLDSLMIARTQVWNQCMTLLGINNANQDKKERLVADEVAANDEQVSSSKWVNLNSRRQACDQINSMYPGLDVHVDFRGPINPLNPELAKGDY